MIRLSLTLCALLGLVSPSGFAQTATPSSKAAAKPAANKSAPKPATTRQKLKSQAKGLALATSPTATRSS